MKLLEKALYDIKPDKKVGLSLIIPEFVLEKANCYWYGGSPYDYCYYSNTNLLELLEGIIVTGFILYAGYKIARKISDCIYKKYKKAY